MTQLWRRRGALGAALAAAVLSACAGQVSRSGSTGTGSGSPGSAGSSGNVTGNAGAGIGTTGLAGIGAAGAPAADPAMCAAQTTPNPGRSPLRRLNLAEYERTVADLLGVDTS